MASLHDPVTLPSGLVLPNRLVKAAMAEQMSDSSRLPTQKHHALYSDWASGGWGMIMTGNVMVDSSFLGTRGDIAASYDNITKRAATLKAWTDYAETCQANGTPAIMQINHPGRQSPRDARKSMLKPNVAPSAVRLDLGSGRIPHMASRLAFGTPREMSKKDIEQVEAAFLETAKLAHEAGFKGVALHAAHGYLLDQFLSPKSNRRSDEYGGSPGNRARIIVNIVRAIHNALPGFVVGMKINSADHQQPGGLEDSLEQIRLILLEKPDFIEISGGSYERPDMIDGPSAGEDAEKAAQNTSTKIREAFFLKYADEVRARYPGITLMVTGGFRSRVGMHAAVASGACDLVGLARPAAVAPRLPNEVILNSSVSDQDAQIHLERLEMPWLVRNSPVKSLTAGFVTKHYSGIMNKRVQARIN